MHYTFTILFSASILAGFSPTQAGIVQDFLSAPRCIMHQWLTSGDYQRNDPKTIKDNIAWIEQNREFYDGAFLFLPTSGFIPFRNQTLDYNKMMGELQPVVGLNSKTLKYNFALLYADKSRDFFDDWTQTVQNWRTFARACKNAGLVGIAFDNEEYFNGFSNYPGDVDYPNKSLSEYRQQARLRGKQIMEAVVQEFPDIVVVTFHGPYIDGGAGAPPKVYNLPGYHELYAPFFVGFIEGRGSRATVVDGGEIYALRTKDDFAKAYQWQKFDLGSNQSNRPFIPPSLRGSNWSNAISISWGLYDLPETWWGEGMNPTLWQSTVRNALERCDHMIWLYHEGRTMIHPSTADADTWAAATRRGKSEGLALRKPIVSSAVPLAPGVARGARRMEFSEGEVRFPLSRSGIPSADIVNVKGETCDP